MYEMCRVRGAGLKTVHLPPYKPFPCFVGLCCYRCDYECTHRCWNILRWVYLKMLKSLGAAFPPEGRRVPSLPFSWAALRALLGVPTVTSHEASSGG